VPRTLRHPIGLVVCVPTFSAEHFHHAQVEDACTVLATFLLLKWPPWGPPLVRLNTCNTLLAIEAVFCTPTFLYDIFQYHYLWMARDSPRRVEWMDEAPPKLGYVRILSDERFWMVCFQISLFVAGTSAGAGIGAMGRLLQL
jgi:hypothetical protein